jgi:hypothetical protein
LSGGGHEKIKSARIDQIYVFWIAGDGRVEGHLFGENRFLIATITDFSEPAAGVMGLAGGECSLNAD